MNESINHEIILEMSLKHITSMIKKESKSIHLIILPSPLILLLRVPIVISLTFPPTYLPLAYITVSITPTVLPLSMLLVIQPLPFIHTPILISHHSFSMFLIFLKPTHICPFFRTQSPLPMLHIAWKLTRIFQSLQINNGAFTLLSVINKSPFILHPVLKQIHPLAMLSILSELSRIYIPFSIPKHSQSLLIVFLELPFINIPIVEHQSASPMLQIVTELSLITISIQMSIPTLSFSLSLLPTASICLTCLFVKVNTFSFFLVI